VEGTPVAASARESWKPSVWSLLCLFAGVVACAFWIIQNHFDSAAVSFLNKFVGKSPLLDGFVELISDTFIFQGVLFVTLLWFIWFKDKAEESRIRLLKGGLATVLTGPLSRLLQLTLTVHSRPLGNPALKLATPIGVDPERWNHWNSFPSDHAALFFALATLICMHNRRLGAFALLWATITSSTRIYLGYHYPIDILGGAALGFCMIIGLQKLPFPRGISRILEWERNAPSSFYAAAFIVSYQTGTLFNDVRAIVHLFVQCVFRHAV
jgi:undecaprenyl-diphosphatase